MKSLPIIAAVAILVLIGAGTWFLVKGNPVSSPQPSPEVSIQQSSTPSTMDSSPSASPSAETGVKEFTIVGSSFKFAPSQITVKQGDKVKITLKNTGGTHDLFIDGYKIQTKVINSGAEDTIEFTADKAGTFDFWCTVGNHKAMGMVGKLVVE